MVERLVRNQQVRGSNPLSSIVLVFRLVFLSAALAALLFSCGNPPEPSEILSFPEEFDISRTRDHIIRQWGEPESVDVEEVPDEFDGQASDVRYTLNYDGIEFLVYDPAASDGELLLSTLVYSTDYALDDGLQVGLRRDRVHELMGPPDLVVDETELYTGNLSQPPSLSIEVSYSGDRVDHFAVYPDIP